jgi:hypothetical protein
MTPDELEALYEPSDSVRPLPPLDGIDDIDWSKLKDAYGPANKVPALLRAFVCGHRDHSRWATEDLFQTIWHQGNVYSATAAVIPFLYNLLEGDGPYEKTDVAHLLATIADGQPSFVHCEHDEKAATEWRAILANVGRDLDTEIAEGHRVAAEIHAQLRCRLDVLYPYLRHSDPELRRSIAVMIGRFPDVAARLLPDLEAALYQESDKYAREALLQVVNAAEKLTHADQLGKPV